MQINSLKDGVKILETNTFDKEEKTKEIEVTKEKISLGEAANKNIRTKVMNYGDTASKLKEEDKEFLKFKEKAGKAVEGLEYNVKGLTSEVIKELEEDGVSATDSESELVKKSVENVVKNREASRENLAKQAEKLAEKAENLKEISYSEVGDEVFAKQLERSGMAVTKENIEKLSGAFNIAKEVVNNINDSAIGHMIERDLQETVSNLYVVEHTQSSSEVLETEEKEETWAKVESQAVELLENKGVTADEESLGAAKWLFTKGMEITPASVAKFLSLNELKEEAESLDGAKKLTERLAKGIAEGKETSDTLVGTANNRQASYVVNYFRKTTQITITEISKRRNLEEIRLKLTEQSAVSMLNKGIKIDVTNLKGLIENLRKEEESYFRGLLDGAKTLENDSAYKAKLSDEGVNQISLLRSVVSIRSYALTKEYRSNYKTGAISAVYREETRITLASYHEAGIAYEKGATEVRADLGDSIRKAFGNIDEVLKENNLELTEANRKAVRLLAYNKAEVSNESVTKMKFATSLAENAIRELKPATVAGLIKSGLNPLDMSMEELFKVSKEINEKIISSEEKYSRYLYKLERAGEVSEPEREAYIGIYRLLNQIEKGDDAAIGSVSLANQSLTLRKMLSAVRTGKLGGFNEKIDGGFGELTKILGGGSKIDSQIDRAYAKMLAGELKENISEVDDSYYEAKEAEISREIQSADVERLLDVGAEVTLSNISAQMDISKGRRSLLGLVSAMSEDEKREVNDLSAKFIDEFDGERFVAENEKAVTEALSKKVTKLMESKELTYNRMTGLIAVKKTIALSVKRGESKTYDIPFIYDEDKLADLTVTLRKGMAEADKGEVGIILTTHESRVTSEFRIVNERITGYFSTDSRERLDDLKFNVEMLKKSLSEMKMEIGEISYHLEQGTSQITNSDDIYNDGVKTSDIYKTAKAVTTYMLKVLKIRE